MKKLTSFQKEIIKSNYKSGMPINYIVELLGYDFPGLKVKLKEQIKDFIKNELKDTLISPKDDNKTKYSSI